MGTTHRSENFEKQRRELLRNGGSCNGENTERESKPPPAHVEREFRACNRSQCKKEPYKPESPHDESKHEAENVKYGTS